MRFKAIWEALSAGKKITDGERILSYKDKLLVDEQGEALDLIPFNADNCDEWEVYDEEAAQQSLYYRYYKCVDDDAMILIIPEWYREDRGGPEGFTKGKQGFTKGEIIGSL